jgi:GNAT superfamily N-acetyltransferase
MIRPATEADVPVIYQLIRDLAEYERSLPEVTGTERQLHEALFAPRPFATRAFARQPAIFAHVAEHEGQVVGFALWFLSFSTWQCQHGIYLEDLYVRPELRGHGYGRQLLAELAALCVERGYGRLDWAVLDWNEPSIGFYRSLGAISVDDWMRFRLTGQPLANLAAGRAGS